MLLREPIIRLSQLNKTYPGPDGSVKALEQVDLEIYPGEILGIIGMSGAGKSTLVRCINYLEKPTSGQVFFHDRDLGTLSHRELNQARRSIGMIFQQFNLLMQRTVLKNVCFPMEIVGETRIIARQRAMDLLQLVGLSDKASTYPARLSGGQRQRVAIARALATNPQDLLCDEATSALDPVTTRDVMDLLQDINQRLGITIVIITHEMSVIESICQRVAILDAHRIVECGPVEAVLTNPHSAAAQRLVFPDGRRIDHFRGRRCCQMNLSNSRRKFEGGR